MAQFGGLASPIPDPTPQPHGAAATTDIPVRGTPDAADAKPEPDTETNPDESKPKPNRDGKIVDTKPAEEPKPDTKPDTEPKPDPKPEPDKATSKPPVKDIGQVTANDDAKTIGKSFGKAYLEAAKSPIKGIPAIMKAEYKAGTALGEKLAGKIAGEGLLKSASRVSLKTAGRLVPGVGTAIGVISAYKNFQQGDYVGAAINVVSAIPGPIGWVGLGASVAWEAFDLGGNKIGQWDSPDGSTTHILPAAAHDIGGVTTLDSQLRQAQQLVFSFQDGPRGKVWDSSPPAALRLDDADIQKEITEALGGVADLFAEVDKVMSSSGEAYFEEYKTRLQPHLEAMAQLREQAKPFTQQLTAASDGAATAYTAVLDANRSAREQLANDSKLSDQGPATSFSSSVAAAVSTVDAADQNIANLFGEPAAMLTATVASGTGTRIDPSKKDQKPVQTTPVAQTPAAVTPTSQTPTPTKTETPTKTNDPLSDLLRSLNQKQQTPSTPSTPNLGNGLGGGSPLGTGGSPLTSQPSKPVDTSGDKKLDDGKKKGDEKKEERKLADRRDKAEEKKATPLSASQTDNKVTKPESKLTTEQKPGNPTVVPAQPSASTATNPAAPGAQGQSAPPEPSKEVDVKGQKTVFPDAKTAKLASLLAAADPAHPLSLADAAKMAGLTPPVPGQDPGSQVAPAQAKPGDLLVAGDKSYLLLGDGRFYDLAEYKVVTADQLPQDMGSRAGYFHLNDPAPGAVPGTQPVSGQTPNAVDQAVPGGIPSASAPTDATPKPTEAAPGAPAPGAVPSAGTPGAPKPAAGGGPASAESTQTGTGQTSPSPSTSALDPSAVR